VRQRRLYDVDPGAREIYLSDNYAHDDYPAADSHPEEQIAGLTGYLSVGSGRGDSSGLSGEATV
jgi:hypothetical protein